jgi:hypothetical protein
MNSRYWIGALALVALSACTTASGPTYNLDAVTTPGGQQAWRVQCDGLFSSAQTCVAKAKSVCGDNEVHIIAAVARPAADAKPHEITFSCERPNGLDAQPLK